MNMFSSLTRDAQRVTETLEELPDGRLITKRGCKIYIPSRFAEQDLAILGVNNYIAGIFAIVVDDLYYGVSTVNAMINIEPTDTNKVKIGDDNYIEFVFAPGSTVFKSVNLVKIDILTYKIYDEIFSKGRVPAYIDYNDLGGIFDTAKYHANANLGTSGEVTELIASMISRDPENKNKYYRTVVKELSDVRDKPPAFIPLRSVAYAATNTTTRLGGSYFDKGVVSALVNPSDRVERIESLLKA
jgi:hypothetical protein